MSCLLTTKIDKIKPKRNINDWSFSDKTIKDIAYITHGYYTYPEKFIPQLAARLIQEYSKIDDIVIDTCYGRWDNCKNCNPTQ